MDRRQRFRLEEKNLIPRIYADEEPDRGMDEQGLAMARAGYSVVSRASHLSSELVHNKPGLARPVRGDNGDNPIDEAQIDNVLY